MLSCARRNRLSPVGRRSTLCGMTLPNTDGANPTVDEDVLRPLNAYVRGYATGLSHFRDAFLR